jgi:hypothetical protein
MKKIAFIVSLLLLSGGFTPAQAAQTKCKDGTYSSSTGRGTCSHHGGVASSSSAEYDKIVARIKKNYGITINGTTSLINVAAAEANLKRQQANQKADAARAAQAKIDDAKKLEAKLNPNNPKQYVMQTDNFVLCREFGAPHSLQNCIGFVICEQLLVNKGYTTLVGNNTRTSLDYWISGGRLVQIEDNPECALIKGTK